MNINRSKSRRTTPWTDDCNATPLQLSIDLWNQSNYRRRHPSISATGEVELLNSFVVSECRHCGSCNVVRFGKTGIGVNRYRCKECGKTFTPITNTIFDSRKISLSEWLDFLLDILSYSSFTLASKGNRNATNTTKYWMDKVFRVLRGYQDDILLREKVYLDEAFYKVRKGDILQKLPGIEYRGVSRNQICIGIACDKDNVVCFEEGKGRTSYKRTLSAFSSHIEQGSRLIHDMESCHDVLVSSLELESEEYDARLLKKVPDCDNPLYPINEKCRLLKAFLNAHSGFMRSDLQDYLNLFTFIMNPPHDKHKKVEQFMIRAINCRILHRYRDEIPK